MMAVSYRLILKVNLTLYWSFHCVYIKILFFIMSQLINSTEMPLD